MRLGGFVACAAVAPLLMGASEPLRLKPSSPWNVDYAQNSCRLIRTFGAENTKTMLIIESSVPDQMDMLAVGKPLATSLTKVAARFLPLGTRSFDGDTAASAANEDPAVLWPQVVMMPDDLIEKFSRESEERHKAGVRPPPLDLAEETNERLRQQEFMKNTTAVEIQNRRSRPLILESGSLGEPMRVFDKCNRDSLSQWGVDPALEDKIVRPVWAINSDRWFTSADYPSSLADRGEESQVEIRVLVDQTGKVTKCTSLSHFKEPEFNKITCEVVTKRAKFAPAELADGTKVPSFYVRRIIFRLER